MKHDDYTVTRDLGPEYEWVVDMQWPDGVTEGGPAVLMIYPSDPEKCPVGGLSQTVLRDVDFKDALNKLRFHLAHSREWSASRERSREKLASLLADHAASGSVTPEYLALLARVYVGAVSQGQDKPLAYLQEVTGKSAASIKNHLWRATRDKYLERSPGRAGGTITGKGADVLKRVIPGADQLLSLSDSIEQARAET